MRLLKAQKTIADEHHDTTIFAEGAAGTGKTTAAIERIRSLIQNGAAPDSILVLVPQAVLGVPYRDALRRLRSVNAANVTITTMSALAVQMVDLFWALIADEIGFEHPLDRPHFLSLELVQYYMTRFIAPEIERNDYFNSVHIDRNRLYTQIVDNLNKAALIGFSADQIADRLKDAWNGDIEQAYIYDDAQACASLFRELCRQHNLLDFSLQINLFADYLWTNPVSRQYLTRQYRHLIVENVEEDTPATHDILTDWLGLCDSALILYDTEGGYRRFLGADPDHAALLKQRCKVHITLDKQRVMSAELDAFRVEMARSLKRPVKDQPEADARGAITYTDNRYLPQMIDWTAENIASLVQDEGVSPAEIVVVSAFLPDVLRFSLQTRLDEKGIPNRAHRPSRALRAEPAARTLLTLAKLAHPQWGIVPDALDVAYALTTSIEGLDLVRARLLTEMLYRSGTLRPFESVREPVALNRITIDLGSRYDGLRSWIDSYRTGETLPPDVFFSRLFGELLSQPRYGFHNRLDASGTATNLIDSARGFRQTVSRIEPDLDIGAEYIRMVDAGVIANQYLQERESFVQDAVLIAPAYAYLMNNAPVDYQFWLNIGSAGWGQRLYQPLTQPYVLSRQWQPGRKWQDADEYEANQDTIYQLVSGLTRRCRKRIYLGFSEFGEQGFEQRGQLLLAVQSMLRRLAKEDQNV